MLQEGDIAVVRSGDDHPYYLLKLDSPPFTTTAPVTDDYHQSLPRCHRVIRGHYLEIFKEFKDRDIYYVDTKKKAYVSSLCVLGISPELQTITQTRRKKKETMFVVDEELHQEFSELVTSPQM